MKNYGLSNLNSFLLALAIYISIVILVFFRLVSEV
ncbi:energy transducer TonB, partial [Campylobacter jejuni]|nr:energy transducer TonB [Campylobacter jejuni]MCE3578875.1 energy transducer TonB [Campylobacter jejuni]